MALTKVTSNVLNDDAVTTSKIVNANVTSSKLATTARNAAEASEFPCNTAGRPTSPASLIDWIKGSSPRKGTANVSANLLTPSVPKI